MDFKNARIETGLSADSIIYYVNEKLVTPIFRNAQDATAAEYADLDIIRLKAIANMRRMEYGMDDIRLILSNPSTAAKLMIEQYAMIKDRQKNISDLAEILDDIDISKFKNTESILNFFANLKLNLPLPGRDINEDSQSAIRQKVQEMERSNQFLHNELLNYENKNKKLGIYLIILAFLLAVSLGFILGPLF